MALVTLWEFNDPANVVDDVTADGTAQDGDYLGGATGPLAGRVSLTASTIMWSSPPTRAWN